MNPAPAAGLREGSGSTRWRLAHPLRRPRLPRTASARPPSPGGQSQGRSVRLALGRANPGEAGAGLRHGGRERRARGGGCGSGRGGGPAAISGEGRLRGGPREETGEPAARPGAGHEAV